VISSSQRPLPDNAQHLQQTDIMPPVGFETTISAGVEAADLRFRPRGHWYRFIIDFYSVLFHSVPYSLWCKVKFIQVLCLWLTHVLGYRSCLVTQMNILAILHVCCMKKLSSERVILVVC